jgi:lysophospholipase L1-like esterase
MGDLKRGMLLLCGLWLFALCSGAPTLETEVNSKLKRALPDLRIQPLGDSITRGNGSPDGNGYRAKLETLLKGTSVDMIGSLKSGSMPDNDHEGHSGEFLEEIASYTLYSIGALPNVVLVHAGTNDMDKDVDLSTAPDRLGKIIDNIQKNDKGVTILVAKIIWANDARMQANTDAFNAQVDSVVASKVAAGVKALVVDMSSIITVDDLWDRKHPNAAGYQKMAQAWYNGIQAANSKGWIIKPMTPAVTTGVGLGNGNAIGTGGTCTGPNWKKMGTVFQGPRVWDDQGVVAPGVSGGSKAKLRLADLTGDKRADYIQVETDGTINVWLNNGNIPDAGKDASWVSIGGVGPALNKLDGFNSSYVRFADVDNDGRADLLVMWPNGGVKTWRNVLSSGKPSFVAMDSAWAVGLEGVPSEQVRFADMNGDGYAGT